MPKPTLHFEILRRIAETASGRRYQDTWYMVTENEPGKFKISTLISDPGEVSDAVVIHCAAWRQPQGPQVTEAWIVSGDHRVDLLSVNVPAHDGYPAREGVAADAVFWSASAVEKFLVPYYASVCGDDAPAVVEKLVSIFVPPDSPERHGPNRAAAVTSFAVIHLPSSEYVDESTPDGLVKVTTEGVHWVL